MDRRTFLNKTTLSLATAGASAVLLSRELKAPTAERLDGNAPAAGPQPAPPVGDDRCRALPARAQTLDDALVRADALGKPLLLIALGASQWKLGQAFGAWVQHAPPHIATALSLVELAVATPVELQELAGGDLDLHAILALVRGEPGARRVEKRTTKIGELETEEELDRVIGELNRHFVELLTAGHPRTDRDSQHTAPLTPSSLERLASGSRAASGCEPPSLDELPSLPLVELDRHAAPIALAAAKLPWHDDARRVEVYRLLAQAARARLVLGPITDRPWATYAGCGLNIDGEQPELVGCGMGHVPEKARRFLYLYTLAEREGSRR